MDGFPAQQWSCDDCQASRALHAQRGRCGDPFGPDLEGARQDLEGRWFIAAGDACKGTASDEGVDALRLYSCPVAAARLVWASAVPAVRAAAQNGAALASLGVGELSEGGAAAVQQMEAAWTWRRALEAEIRREAAKAASKKGG